MKARKPLSPRPWPRMRAEVRRNPVFAAMTVFSILVGLLGLTAGIGFIRANGRFPAYEGEVANWLFGLDGRSQTPPCDPQNPACRR